MITKILKNKNKNMTNVFKYENYDLSKKLFMIHFYSIIFLRKEKEKKKNKRNLPSRHNQEAGKFSISGKFSSDFTVFDRRTIRWN